MVVLDPLFKLFHLSYQSICILVLLTLLKFQTALLLQTVSAALRPDSNLKKITPNEFLSHLESFLFKYMKIYFVQKQKRWHILWKHCFNAVFKMAMNKYLVTQPTIISSNVITYSSSQYKKNIKICTYIFYFPIFIQVTPQIYK